MLYLTCPCVHDKEWEKLTHAILTSNKDWDQTVLDCEDQVDNELQFDPQSSFPHSPDDKTFNEVDDYRFRSNNNQLLFFDAESFKYYNLDIFIQSFTICNNLTTKTNETEYDLLQPLFNWIPSCIIKNNFQLSTHNSRTLVSSVTKKTCRSPCNALNSKRRSEPTATDKV